MKRLLIISIMLFELLSLAAQNCQYPYVVTDACDMTVSDDFFYAHARSVTFRAGTWDIPEDDHFAQELINDVLPQMDACGLHLKKILMRGAASLEGPHEINVKLGQKRLLTIYNIIKEHAVISACDDCVFKTEIAEDYPYLLRLMQENNDPDYEKVKSIVEKYGEKDVMSIKKELKSIRGMSLWLRLMEEYFPKLRAAHVILFFAHYDDPNAGSRVEVMTPDTTLSVVTPVDTSTLYKPINIGQLYKKPSAGEKQPRRELLSVKTNLLMDFAYMPAGYDRFCPMPNVAIEYYPLHGHFTWGASFDIPWHQDYDGHKYFQARNYQLETRYYFQSGDVRKNPPGEGAAFRGLYVQGYAHATKYGVMFLPRHGAVGEGIGAGIGLGYVVPLTKPGHLRLEMGAQFGWFYSQYDPFQYECPVDPTEHDNLYYYKWTLASELFKERQYRFTWLGPTRIGLTLTWDLLYRKNKNKN